MSEVSRFVCDSCIHRSGGTYKMFTVMVKGTRVCHVCSQLREDIVLMSGEDADDVRSRVVGVPVALLGEAQWMTRKRQLAWCYLTAAIAACAPGTTALMLNGLLQKFFELADMDQAVWVSPFEDVSTVRGWLLSLAEKFLASASSQEGT